VKINQNILIYIIIVAFTFILYGNTIPNEYALDDAIAITENQFTKDGFSGIKDIFTNESFTGFFGKKKNLVAGGRYRPLSMVTFAIEYELFGLNPHISHFINVLLYALTGIVIFMLLSMVNISTGNQAWYLGFPFVATLLFIAHPIHTEAIANIKGRDEILAFLGALLALKFTLDYLDKGKMKYLAYSGMMFFLGLLSKENTVTFLGVIPLTTYFFTSHSLKKNMASLLPLAVAFAVFMIIRTNILGAFTTKIPDELMNNPFLHASVTEKYATIFLTLGMYIKLLFIPHPLTYDYYPYHIPIIGWDDPRALISLTAYILLIIIALYGLKKKTVIPYGIAFYLLTLSIVSNILFPIGVFMSERFLYMPSLGFSIIMAWLILHYGQKAIQNPPVYRRMAMTLLLLILAGYSIKTISRNIHWKDDFTLFTHDVKTSSNSAKSNCTAGGKLLEKTKDIEDEQQKKEYLHQSIKYLKKSVSIHPKYKDAWLLLGNAWFEYNKNYDSTLYCYKQILKQNPNYALVYENINKILTGYDNTKHKISIYKDLYKINPNRFEINYNLGVLWGKHMGDMEKAIYYLERAVKIKPENIAALKDLGVAYGFSGKYKQSIGVLQRALKIKPDDPELYLNLGLSSQKSGQINKAKQYFAKAKALRNE